MRPKPNPSYEKRKSLSLPVKSRDKVDKLPPRTPYVNMSILTDVLNVLSTKATHDMILPAIQTARHPYLLANADTTGPNENKMNFFFNFVP